MSDKPSESKAEPRGRTGKPKRHVGVLLVHGINANDLTYAEPFMRAVRGRLSSEEWGRVHWHPVFWADAVRPHQSSYLYRSGLGADTIWDYLGLRRFVISGLADAASYEKSFDPNDSVYEDIQRKLTRGIKHLKDANDPDRPLIIVAHSLGCHIVSTYIHDTWRDRRKAYEHFDGNESEHAVLRRTLASEGVPSSIIDHLLVTSNTLGMFSIVDKAELRPADADGPEKIFRQAFESLCTAQITELTSKGFAKDRITAILDRTFSLNGLRLRTDMRRRGLSEESIHERMRGEGRLRTERFEDLQSLVGLYTLGCNIPVFTFRYHPFQIRPIPFPKRGEDSGSHTGFCPAPEIAKIAEWINFYSRFDPLGYPLKPLSPDYAARVDEDVRVVAGDGLWRKLSPLSHTGYLMHRRVVGRIAAQIRRALAL